MGFTKLDSGILQSSIMSAPASTFKVWIAILASTGPDGIAHVSATFLSASCYLPMSTVEKSLETLSSPDRHSRSLNDDGRRIERVDGGYRVINYEKYRAFAPNEGDPHSPGAIRTRRWRERVQSVTTPPVVTDGDVTPVTSASASASSSVFSSEEGKSEGGRKKVTSPKIALNLQSWEWVNIGDADMRIWAEAYPAVDINLALKQMAAWCKDHQADGKGRKSNWSAFITRWLKKEQDRGGNRGQVVGRGRAYINQDPPAPTLKPEELSRLREQAKSGELSAEDAANVERHYGVSLR